LIRRLWRVLDRQSLVLSAERKDGEDLRCPKDGGRSSSEEVAYLPDLEGIRTPLEFVETVFRDVEDYLGRLQRTAGRVREWLAHLETEDNEMARSVLTLLQRGHYVVLQPDSRIRFRFPLIQCSWRLQRGLES